MVHLSLRQRLLSLFYPVKLRSSASLTNPVLELYYYRGQYQLATEDALYSDGPRYRPLLAAFKTLRKDFAQIRSVLVLGTGLGSAAYVAHKMGYHPHFTFVDIDAEVLEWAAELMPPELRRHSQFTRADAGRFLEDDRNLYDLIVIDIFIGREVPAFVTGRPFMDRCRWHLNAGGRVIMNCMVAKGNDATAQEKLNAVFGKSQVLSFGLNRVYITVPLR